MRIPFRTNRRADGACYVYLQLFTLRVPRTRRKCFDRAFSVAGPKLWNVLTDNVKNSESLVDRLFKKRIENTSV